MLLWMAPRMRDYELSVELSPFLPQSLELWTSFRYVSSIMITW